MAQRWIILVSKMWIRTKIPNTKVSNNDIVNYVVWEKNIWKLKETKAIKDIIWLLKLLLFRYRLQVQVSDETGTTTFVLFDNEAKKIVYKTAKEFAETYLEVD